MVPFDFDLLNMAHHLLSVRSRSRILQQINRIDRPNTRDDLKIDSLNFTTAVVLLYLDLNISSICQKKNVKR